MKEDLHIGLDLNLLRFKHYLKVKINNDQSEVFDPVRRKYVTLTPEEFVRQLFLQYLIREADVSRGRIAIEKKISNRKMDKRFDILVFSNNGKPWMVVECKSAKIDLNQSTLDQIDFYNTMIEAPYMLITNGKQNFCFQMDGERGIFKLIKNFPVS